MKKLIVFLILLGVFGGCMIEVSPTKNKPTHHLKCVDADATEMGFICIDAEGNRIPRVGINPYPSFASQLRQGRAKHSDRQPPFEDIALSDFSGGLGMLHHDEDASKYLDGKRIDTSQMGEVVHGGQETYTTGLRDFNESWPGDVEWQALYSGGTESITTDFTANASYNVNSIVVILKKVGTPTGDVTVSLRDSSGALLSADSTKALTIVDDFGSDIVSERIEFTMASVQAITDTTAYKVRVAYSGGSATAYIDVAVDGSDDLFYRVLDDTGGFDFQMVEYLDALYGITKPHDGSVSKLYILGARGLADANTGALTTLVDATKSWTTNEWAGKVVKIIGGHNEEQNWRTISSNTSDTLTISPAWTVEHGTNTQYVIMGNAWVLKETLTAKAQDVAVVWNKMYIGFGFVQAGTGTDMYTRRYYAHNVSGVWTESIDVEDNDIGGASKIVGIYNPRWKYPSGYSWDYYKIIQTQTSELNLFRFQAPLKDEDLTNVLGVLVQNDRAWVSTLYANVNPEPYYWGSTLVVHAGFATGIIAHWKLDSPLDLSGAEAIMLYYNVAPAADAKYESAGDITIVLTDSDGVEDEYNFDGTTDVWQNQLIFLESAGSGGIDYQNIADVYLKINTDDGAVNINLSGPIYFTGDRGLPKDRWREFPLGLYANTIINYAGGAGQPIDKPWILCNKGAYYIEDNAIKRIPLGEMEELEHPRSGEGAVVSDVYLYFNMGPTIQRYYAGHLDSVGPDIDYGLPANRRGIPCTMAAYPGKVLAGIDAETGYSSVIYRKNHGWHELYRATENDRIKSIHIVGRADTVDRVYIQEGSDVLWVPISLNPQTESDYEYTYESVLETSRVYGGLRETEKYYHAITLVTEDLSGTDQYIQVDYRTSESSTWTTIGTDFSTSPRQRQSLVSTNDTDGRWIQFRFRSYTADNAITPKIISAVIDSLERVDVNNMYQYTIELKEGIGKMLEPYGADNESGVDKLTQLETWVDDPKPLTLYTVSAFENNKLVFLEGVRKKVLYHMVGDIKQELRVADLTFIEVS